MQAKGHIQTFIKPLEFMSFLNSGSE